MSSNEKLLQAALNCLGARVGQKLIASIADLTLIAKDAPEKIRTEWESFQEEVISEANRLDEESNENSSNNPERPNQNKTNNPHKKIAQIREQVAQINIKLEAKN